MLITVLSAHAAFGIKLYIDGEEVQTDVSPIIINSRTMVPARVLFEKFNATVDWDESTSQVHIKGENTDIVFTVGINKAVVNGTEIELDVAPMILKERTLVPIRFISENLGYNVSWDDITKSVFITSDKYSSEEKSDCIQAVYVENGNVVNVMLSSEVSPRISTVDNPFRLILDFDNIYISPGDGKNTLSNYYLNEVRWAEHDSYSRVVLEFNGQQKYMITGDGTKLFTVTLGVESRDELYSGAVPSPDTMNNEWQNSQAQEEFVASGEFADTLVVIDAGHGGKDTGALARGEDGEVIVDIYGNPALMEKDINLVIAQKIRDRLQANGIPVLMTRDDDSFFGTSKENLMARCELANNNNATLFVSVHNNSAQSPKATGTEICYTEESTGLGGVTSKTLANNILPYLTEATGLANRGIINRPNLVVLKNTTMPAALLECAFLSSEKDRAVLTDETKLDAIADGVVKGIIKTLRQINW